MSNDNKVMLPKSNILWTMKSAVSTINKRGTITEAEAREGAKKAFTIRGEGNLIDVRNKAGELVAQAQNKDTVLRKKILNVLCNSDVAMRNPRNKALLATAMKLEKEGKAQDAANHYNAFLNAIEISFSVLENDKNIGKLGDRVDIEAKCQLVETENGKLITLDASSIRVLKADAAKKITFSAEDYFGTTEESVAATTDAPSASEVLADELSGITA